MPKYIIDNQVIAYPLLMTLARLSWAFQSLLYVVYAPKVASRPVESFFIAGHWLGCATRARSCGGPTRIAPSSNIWVEGAAAWSVG